MHAATILLTASLVATVVAPVPFTTISHTGQSNIEAPRQVVVRTPEEWKTLWRAHAPDQPMPAVDFTRSMVIGVFLGARNSGGHKATIIGIESDGSTLTVSYREDRPGPDTIVTQVITFPHHLVRVERTAGKVKFTPVDR